MHQSMFHVLGVFPIYKFVHLYILFSLQRAKSNKILYKTVIHLLFMCGTN